MDMDMLKYYDIKEKFQVKFLDLEKEMTKCFREVDTEGLKKVNKEYDELLKEYKKLL